MQQTRYGVEAGTLVLLEVLPSSHAHEVGPTGRFRFRPYELHLACDGWVQVQENWEFWTVRRPFVLQGVAASRQGTCPATLQRGLSRPPDRGDIVTISVIDAENNNWGVLVSEIGK